MSVAYEARKWMAVWHVEFAMVPRRALAASSPLAVAEIMDTDWWRTIALPPGYGQQLAAVAPAEPSRTVDLQTWGPADGNRVDVWSENGRPVRMIVRVDVRRLDARFGAMVLQFARIADAMLVRGDGLVIEPRVGAFGAALRSSEAWRYATDPAAHFGSYAEPGGDEQ